LIKDRPLPAEPAPAVDDTPFRTAQIIQPIAPEQPPLAGPMPPSGIGQDQLQPPFGTEPADPPVPQVIIRVRVPARVNPKQDLEYRIAVQNVSQAPAHQVRVRIPLPDNATYVKATPEPAERQQQLVWQFGTLPAGARKDISLVLNPTGSGDVDCCARVQFEHGQCVRTRLAQPDLRVRLIGPTQLLLNDSKYFSVEVTNAGQRNATNVVLTNTLPDGLLFQNSTPSTPGNNPLIWNLGTLAPGQAKTVKYLVLVEKTGTLLNKAEVKDDTGRKQETSLQLSVGEPRLTLSMGGPEKRTAGRPTIYILTVANPGTRPVTNVELVDYIPKGVDFVSATLGGYQREDELRWNLGTITPGARQTVQVVMKAKGPGEFTNRAYARADRDLKASAEFKTVFEAGSAGLTLDIDKSSDPLEVGKPVTYTVRIVNQGNAAATGVRVSLTLPDELAPKNAKGPTEAQQLGQKYTFAPLATLAAGGEAAFVVNAEALKAGNVRVSAEVSSDQLGANPLRSDESTTIYAEPMK
jgi:uncharacterized repeat protein (TIGR01451 family)